MALSGAERQKRFRERQREQIEPLRRLREGCAVVDYATPVSPMEKALHELGDALFVLRAASTRQEQRAQLRRAERKLALAMKLAADHGEDFGGNSVGKSPWDRSEP